MIMHIIRKLRANQVRRFGNGASVQASGNSIRARYNWMQAELLTSV
jgi:hypothetical protein